MNKLHTRQEGFGFVAVLAVLVVVGAVAVVGLRVVGNHSASLTTAVSTSPVKVPAKLTSKADVQQASSALDATNVDTGVNPDQLNNDLNSLL